MNKDADARNVCRQWENTQRLEAAARGFTLIEVLVALAIMALLAAMSWRGIDAMVRTQHSVQDNSRETLALQAGLLQWRADLDAMMVWPEARASGRRSAAARIEAAWLAQRSLYWDGRALRITRLDSGSGSGAVGSAGVRVVAWARSPLNGQWLRWLSAPCTSTQQWRSAWAAAGEWGRAPSAPLLVGAGGASATAIARAEDWQLHYFRRNAWSNALSSAEDAENAEEHTSLPDGVRLRLLLAPGQAVSGEVTVDWVRPSFSGT